MPGSLAPLADPSAATDPAATSPPPGIQGEGLDPNSITWNLLGPSDQAGSQPAPADRRQLKGLPSANRIEARQALEEYLQLIDTATASSAAYQATPLPDDALSGMEMTAHAASVSAACANDLDLIWRQPGYLQHSTTRTIRWVIWQDYASLHMLPLYR